MPWLQSRTIVLCEGPLEGTQAASEHVDFHIDMPIAQL